MSVAHLRVDFLRAMHLFAMVLRGVELPRSPLAPALGLGRRFLHFRLQLFHTGSFRANAEGDHSNMDFLLHFPISSLSRISSAHLVESRITLFNLLLEARKFKPTVSNAFVSDIRTIWASNAFYACCPPTSSGFPVCFVTTTVGYMSVYSSAAQLCNFQIGKGASIVVEIDSIRSVTFHICRKRLPIYSFCHMNNISRMYNYHLVDFLFSCHRRCTFM